MLTIVLVFCASLAYSQPPEAQIDIDNNNEAYGGDANATAHGGNAYADQHQENSQWQCVDNNNVVSQTVINNIAAGGGFSGNHRPPVNFIDPGGRLGLNDVALNTRQKYSAIDVPSNGDWRDFFVSEGVQVYMFPTDDAFLYQEDKILGNQSFIQPRGHRAYATLLVKSFYVDGVKEGKNWGRSEIFAEVQKRAEKELPSIISELKGYDWFNANPIIIITVTAKAKKMAVNRSNKIGGSASYYGAENWVFGGSGGLGNEHTWENEWIDATFNVRAVML